MRLVDKVTEPILKVLAEHHDLGAAHALFNLSCVHECRPTLFEQGIHLKMIDFLSTSNSQQGENAVRAIYLQILVQIASLKECILDLLKV